MERYRFPADNLDDRAGLLLEDGSFLALRKEKGKTCALYELYGMYVEVIIKKREVTFIDFLYDTDRLAAYVKKQLLKPLLL
jgi:hypothetical protein